MMVNLININDKTLWWQVEREKFDESTFITITDDQYNMLKNVENKYIVFDDVDGVKTPREMTAEEKQAYENANPPPVPTKEPMQIMTEIYQDFTSTEQGIRIVHVFRKYPDFAWYLMDYSYGVASMVIEEALQNGDIVQEDRDLVISKLPGMT
jgi:hypothetical protein